MLKEYYKDHWVTFSIDVEQSLLLVIWHDDGTLTAQTYKEQMLKARELVEIYQPSKNLSDARHFQLNISPELQAWISKNVFQKRGQEILKRYAIVVPYGVFAQIALEQLMEESDRDTMTRYFDDLAEAENWLGVFV
ncbi:MAG: hypothetical protein EAZ95_13930 [Bacteroidetes bacterium]|nr:MAG: hypothetical protein EAZ95_13930 [Bacteroidota bacterium]